MEEDGKEVVHFSGTVGDIGTSSFYPPHHMTMGEGGAVYTNNPLLNKIIRCHSVTGEETASVHLDMTTCADTALTVSTANSQWDMTTNMYIPILDII